MSPSDPPPYAFDPDATDLPVTAMNLEATAHDREAPMHAHRKGQLVVTLRGGVICRTETGLWMVPAGNGVGVPGHIRHSNEITANGRVALLFIDAEVGGLPDRCASLTLTPLVVELVRHLAERPAAAYQPGDHLHRLVQVLLEELRVMQVSTLHLPIPDDPALRHIANGLIQNPRDRAPVSEWARRVAMSERSLSRLVRRRTAMSFGRWRQQLQILIALQRLSEGASVQTVAYDLGYESVSAFITMFKSALGKPPARYVADAAL